MDEFERMAQKRAAREERALFMETSGQGAALLQALAAASERLGAQTRKRQDEVARCERAARASDEVMSIRRRVRFPGS